MTSFEADTVALRTGASSFRKIGTAIGDIDPSTTTKYIGASLPGSKAGATAALSGTAVETAFNAVTTRMNTHADSTASSADAFDTTEADAVLGFKELRLP